MDAVLEDYNLNRTPQALVLFEMALSHLTRVHRIIRLPRGNALLVGVGGSGKQSLTRLATYCAGYDIFSIQLMRGYGEIEFREDLKTLYKLLGTKEVVFLFTDAHVALEGFLEFLNNMLTTGMVPALYEQDEMDGAFSASLDSCPSHDAVGGFVFDFELFRTASGPSRRVGETAVASMASARRHATVKPSTRPHETSRAQASRTPSANNVKLLV